MLPILYSFRRCPYAMRARLALYYAGQRVELREVVLKAKPPELLAVSSKATVPVLVAGAAVIDQSLDIMQWALARNDPDGWLINIDGPLFDHHLIKENDVDFKPLLDRYKYFDRYPEYDQEHYFRQALPYLAKLEQRLIDNKNFLSGDRFGVLDAAIFPFVRQFAHCDSTRFAQLGLPALQTWLQACLSAQLFESVMIKYPAWSSQANNAVVFAG